MKKHILDALHRGLLACGAGPVVLAIIYIIIGLGGNSAPITLTDAAKGILTITELAFISGALTVLYQIERLPLFPALLIHGVVLYLDYLSVYLINGWLQKGSYPLIVFTICFVLGYAIIWACIYLSTLRKTKELNTAIKNEV